MQHIQMYACHGAELVSQFSGVMSSELDTVPGY